MRVTTPLYCLECGHLHDDYCDAAVLEPDGAPAICGCHPPCDPCIGTGNGRISGWADEDGACQHCAGTGKQPENTDWSTT